MTQPTTTLPGLDPQPPALQAASDEVRKFAEEHGVAQYLAGLVGLMARIVPGRPISLRLECDPSIPDDWYITLSIDVSGMTADDLFAAHCQWVDGLIALCPPNARQFFHFGM